MVNILMKSIGLFALADFPLGQKVVAAITASGRHNDWIGEFRAKYGV